MTRPYLLPLALAGLIASGWFTWALLRNGFASAEET